LGNGLDVKSNYDPNFNGEPVGKEIFGESRSTTILIRSGQKTDHGKVLADTGATDDFNVNAFFH
jgi:hypothetical protein